MSYFAIGPRLGTPAEAVSTAGTLIWNVMRDRGYPVDDRRASLEALSVYHAEPLTGYRQVQDIRTENATTEELREAMIRYRAGAGDRELLTEDGAVAADNSDRTVETPR